MKLFITANLIGKIVLPGLVSATILISQGLDPLVKISTTALDVKTSTGVLNSDLLSPSSDLPNTISNSFFNGNEDNISFVAELQKPDYQFGNPAGCADASANPSSSDEMINKVQMALGDEYNLAERKQTTIWNGELGVMVDATQDPFVFEFAFNEFQHPYTYRGDKVATIFMANGFVVWFRAYGQNFRLLAIPMTEGVLESSWAGYINSYWQKNGLPSDDYIYPVMKKLPCHRAIDDGYVSTETISEMFDLDWNMPDYLKAGRQYLASNCEEANRISQEKVKYWDATSMCGPLAWTIMRDANGFPYRIGSWSANANPFIKANPKGNGQPWDTFDPETFTLTRTDAPMPGYDFNSNGNLFPGDLIYSYSSFYKTQNDQEFDHIFIIAGIDNNNTRLSISNMVRNQPYSDCSIEEIPLYTPGDLENGVINHEWNGFGFGQTGASGFDIFRWDWITYHLNGNPIQYTVRWGDTAETIAFDWKVAPNRILAANHFTSGIQLIPGQIIILPEPIPVNNF